MNIITIHNKFNWGRKSAVSAVAVVAWRHSLNTVDAVNNKLCLLAIDTHLVNWLLVCYDEDIGLREIKRSQKKVERQSWL